MSCIVGIASGDTVFMGADSAGVNSSEELQLRTDSKVFHVSGLLVGVAGDPLAAQKIRYVDFLLLDVLEYEDAHKAMSKVVIPSFEFLLKGIDFDMLVGLGGHLFHVYKNFQFTEEQAGYDAAGSGAQVARGALYATDHEPHVSPQVRIKLALQASERFCSGVRAPFNISKSGGTD